MGAQKHPVPAGAKLILNRFDMIEDNIDLEAVV